MVETINGRYELHEKLGSGGMGSVYRARDKLTDTIIALKRVTAQFAQPSDENGLQISLANEFQALASLRHPNIIPVLDYGFDKGLPYFTMKYIPAARTITEVGKEAGYPEKIKLLIQMLQALAYLHRRGIIHRDLKPQNALIDEEGNVMLLDFGLAEENPKASGDGTISGTLAYIAPEVLQGEAPTEASDLFAFGLIAYEIFAGYYPFDEANIVNLVTDIIKNMPELNELDISLEFETIFSRLLAKTPDLRYRQSTQVMEDLAHAGLMDLSNEDPENRNSYLQAAKFVGRDIELDRLETALQSALDGQGSTWLIGGESGVGKSRLLSELQIRAMVQGAIVLRGQAVLGGGLPYQLWRNPVQRLALVTEISDIDATILKQIAPEIERLLDYDIADAPVIDKETAKTRLINAIVALLSTYDKPIVLLLEDLQWASESLDVIKQLNQLASDLPLLLLASYRSDERPNLVYELPSMKTLNLDRLNSFEIADLSASMIGESGRAPQVVDLLSKETEGNIFFLIETVRALAEEAGTLDNIGRMTLPPTVFAGGVQRVVDRRLTRIPEAFIPLLQLAAVAGRQINLQIIGQCAGELNLEEWLDVSVNSAVISIQDGQYRFSHDKIREGLLARIDESELVKHHRQVAEAIETAYPGDNSFSAVLSQHWKVAQNLNKEAHYSYITARQLQDKDTLLAREYAQRALNFIEDDESDVRLPEIYAIQGRIYLSMSDYQLARNSFEQGLRAAEIQQSRLYQARCLEGLGQVAIRSNDLDEAMNYLQIALDRAERTLDNTLIGLVMNSIASVHMEWGEFEEARILAEKSLSLAQSTNDRPGIARDLNILGVIASRTGDLQGAWKQFEQVLEIRRSLGMRHGEASILNNMGVIASSLGHFEESIKYHDESRKIKSEIGDRFGLGNSLQNLGQAYINLGEYEKAKAYSTDALTIARELNDRAGEADIRNNLGVIIRRMGGDLQEAREHLEEAIVVAGEIEDRLTVAFALSNLGDVLIALDEIIIAEGILNLSLRECYVLNAMQPLLRTIMWLAKLIQIEGDEVYATRLWSFVNLHPGCDAETRDDSENLLMTVVNRLSAESMAQAIEESKQLSLDAVVENLQDMSALG